MEHNRQDEVRADRWEFIARVIAYGIVFVSAALFIDIIFQDARLVAQYQTGIDALSYADAHLDILLVEIGLWSVMATAATRFKAYTWRIRHSDDGAALNLIANAMLLSFIYAILFDIASSVKSLFMGTRFLSLVTTITNLVPLAVFLLLSVLLFIGSRRLARLVSGKPAFRQRRQRLTAVSLAGFVLLVVLFGNYFYHVASVMVDDDGLRHFTLAPPVLIVVYLIPFTIIWLLGLLSCLNLAWYARMVPGKIYKPTFRSLYVGILLSYVSTFLIQLWYVSNLPSNRFGFGLSTILCLIVLLIVGYCLMYRGANQLYMLERGPHPATRF